MLSETIRDMYTDAYHTYERSKTSACASFLYQNGRKLKVSHQIFPTQRHGAGANGYLAAALHSLEDAMKGALRMPRESQEVGKMWNNKHPREPYRI